MGGGSDEPPKVGRKIRKVIWGLCLTPILFFFDLLKEWVVQIFNGQIINTIPICVMIVGLCGCFIAVQREKTKRQELETWLEIFRLWCGVGGKVSKQKNKEKE